MVGTLEEAEAVVGTSEEAETPEGSGAVVAKTICLAKNGLEEGDIRKGRGQMIPHCLRRG